MINEKEISKLVAIKDIETQDQNPMTGQVLTYKKSAILCPSCSYTLYKFNQTLPYLAIVKVIAENLENFKNDLAYCPHCGQKLNFEREVVQVNED